MESNLPILGQGPAAGTVIGIGATPMVLMRELNADGLAAATVVRNPDGSVRPVLARGDFLDAEQLLEAIESTVRRVFREEFALAMQRFTALKSV